MSAIGRKISLSSFAFRPSSRRCAPSTSRSPRVHDSNLNGPVPIGCSVPNVPVGWKPVVLVDRALVGVVLLQRLRARDREVVSASAPRNEADGFVRLITTVFSSVASQLL